MFVYSVILVFVSVCVCVGVRACVYSVPKRIKRRGDEPAVTSTRKVYIFICSSKRKLKCRRHLTVNGRIRRVIGTAPLRIFLGSLVWSPPLACCFFLYHLYLQIYQICSLKCTSLRKYEKFCHILTFVYCKTIRRFLTFTFLSDMNFRVEMFALRGACKIDWLSLLGAT